MFNWGRSLYRALRAAIYGAIFGLVVAIVFKLTGDQGELGAVNSMVEFFCLFGLARLGWDSFKQKYPDA